MNVQIRMQTVIFTDTRFPWYLYADKTLAYEVPFCKGRTKCQDFVWVVEELEQLRAKVNNEVSLLQSH